MESSLKDPSVIRFREYTFAYLKDTDHPDLSILSEKDALIIECSDKYFYSYIIKKIRQHTSDDISLKPVFLYNKVEYVDDTIIALVDGVVVDMHELEKPYRIVVSIKERIAHLKPTDPDSFESFILLKALRYQYSRGNSQLEVFHDRSSKLGFSYPILSAFYNFEEQYKILDNLKVAEEEGIVSGTFKDVIYSCNNCLDSFLHYRESCSHCHSTDLESEDIIHHFPCAYVGPASDFKSDSDTFYCPKCDKALKHIGIDYDKPSAIYNCLSCSKSFQDALIKAKCQSCGTDTQVDFLTKRIIKKYKINQKGEFMAVHGGSIKSKSITIPGTVTPEMFSMIIQHELDRLQTLKVKHSMGYLRIDDFHLTFKHLGAEAMSNLIAQIVYAIKANLKTADLVAIYEEGNFIFSLFEKDNIASNRFMLRLSEQIKRLFSDNFNKEIVVVSNSIELDNQSSFTDNLNQLKNSIQS